MTRDSNPSSAPMLLAGLLCSAWVQSGCGDESHGSIAVASNDPSAAVAGSSQPAAPTAGLTAHIDAAITSARSRVLEPMPGWRLVGLDAAVHEDHWIRLQASIDIDRGQAAGYVPVARAVCRHAGRAFVSSSSFSEDGGGFAGFSEPPATGERVTATTSVYTNEGAPCQIELRTQPIFGEAMYSLGTAWCFESARLREGPCSDLVERPSTTVTTTASVEELELRPNGQAEFIVTAHRSFDPHAEIALRSRCPEGRHVRTFASQSFQGWGHLEPGESRRDGGELSSGAVRDDCEITVEYVPSGTAPRDAPGRERLYTACRQAGQLVGGACPAETWAAIDRTDVADPIELVSGKLSPIHYHRGDPRVSWTVELAFHRTMRPDQPLGIELECTGKGWNHAEPWGVEGVPGAVTDLGHHELATFTGASVFSRRPGPCTLVLVLAPVAPATKGIEVARYCARPGDPLGTCP